MMIILQVMIKNVIAILPEGETKTQAGHDSVWKGALGLAKTPNQDPACKVGFHDNEDEN